MDNKIIFELIKKDIEELKLIVEALENSREPQSFLIDIAMSKTQNLSQEISLLRRNEKTVQPAIPVSQSTQIPVETEHEVVVEGTLKESILKEDYSTTNIDESPKQAIQSEIDIEPEIVQPISKIEPEQTEPKVEEITSPDDQTLEQVEVEKIVEPEPATPKEDRVEEQINREAIPVEKKVAIEEETEPITIGPENQTEKSHMVLGEKFTKEPSLNERFTSTSDNQYKIKGKPVTSIKGAIGLNDRFMYTRELFGNDKNKFEITVETLDKAAGLVEAIEYLEQNFQWQKNDTSLKFMELVKRRFEN